MHNRITKRRIRRPGLRRHESKPADSRPSDRFIECAPSLLSDIREATPGSQHAGLRLKLEFGGRVVDKELFAKHGRSDQAPGGEIYGVLLGRRDPPALRVVAFRHLDINLTADRANPLSDAGRQAFAGLMAKIRWDPQLAGVQPVGWFRAGPCADLNLSHEDLEVFNRFFSLPWQIGAVVQAGAVARARFFLRESDGSLHAATAFRDVAAREKSDVPIVLERDPRRVPAFAPPAFVAGPVDPHPQHARKPLWPAAVLAAGIVTAGAWWIMRPPSEAPASSHRAQAAIQDANQLATMQAEALWKKWEDEAKRQASNAPTADSAQPDLPALAEEPLPIETKPAEPPRREVRPEARTDTNRLRPDTSSLRRSFSTAAPSKNAPVAQLEAPPVAPTREAAPPPPLSARIIPPPASPPAQPAAPSPAPPATPPPAVTQTASSSVARPTPPPAKPPLPSSGRFIWTGRLRKNEYVVFDGSTASVGSASGGLPGRPVELSVSPGDLTKAGLIIYSPHVPVAGHSRESPGPQNGWNSTLFEWDPDRARDVEIVEAPSPKNAWKRLVLRCRSQRDSVILVEWKTLAQ